jgi:acetyl-CoA carboxylase carboxyl transferase subunit beta
MTWLHRVRNALPFAPKRETPDNLWTKCPGCEEMLFTKEYEANLSVCPRCGHHGRIGAEARFAQLLDPGFEVLPAPKVREDPLKFRDSKKYTDRLRAARAGNPHYDALTNAFGAIDGRKAVVGVQEFAFMGGSMGIAVGAAFVDGVRRAVAEQCPFVVFTASGGARMQEGVLSLMQMPKTTAAIHKLRAANLPYVVVLTDPTSGGVMAAYAMLGDIHIAEPRATLAFTGRRVIENTIRAKLPDDFQTSEYYFDHGMIDMIVPRAELRATLAKVLDYLSPAARAA